MALAWESEASWITKSPGMIQSQQQDCVCQDTGSAGPSGKVLLTPQQEQPKQQYLPENTARTHSRNVSSLLVPIASFMSCFFLHHHSFKIAMPTPFSPCTVVASQCSAIQYQSECCCNSLYYSPVSIEQVTQPPKLPPLLPRDSVLPGPSHKQQFLPHGQLISQMLLVTA